MLAADLLAHVTRQIGLFEQSCIYECKRMRSAGIRQMEITDSVEINLRTGWQRRRRPTQHLPSVLERRLHAGDTWRQMRPRHN